MHRFRLSVTFPQLARPPEPCIRGPWGGRAGVGCAGGRASHRPAHDRRDMIQRRRRAIPKRVFQRRVWRVLQRGHWGRVLVLVFPTLERIPNRRERGLLREPSGARRRYGRLGRMRERRCRLGGEPGCR